MRGLTKQSTINYRQNIISAWMDNVHLRMSRKHSSHLVLDEGQRYT